MFYKKINNNTNIVCQNSIENIIITSVSLLPMYKL